MKIANISVYEDTAVYIRYGAVSLKIDIMLRIHVGLLIAKTLPSVLLLHVSYLNRPRLISYERSQVSWMYQMV